MTSPATPQGSPPASAPAEAPSPAEIGGALTVASAAPGKRMTNDNLPAAAEPRASKPRRFTGKLKVALDAIVHEAAEMDVAAAAAGLTTRAIRKAIGKPWVIAYMREQRALLLTELTAGNPHHLRTLRGSSPNQLARLGAVREIENIADGRRGGSNNVINVGVHVQAGFILDLTEREGEP